MCASKGTAPVTTYYNQMAAAQQLVSQQPNQYQQFLGYMPSSTPVTPIAKKESPAKICDPPELIMDDGD